MKEEQICIELLNKTKKLIKDTAEKTTNESENQIIKKIKPNKKNRQICHLGYLNESNCAGTILESGKNHEEIVKKIMSIHDIKPSNKYYKDLYNFFLNMRKNIFKTKDNVVKDGFYEKLTKNDIRELKEKGAKTGCTIANPFANPFTITIKKQSKKNKKTIKKQSKNIISNK